MCSSDLLLFPAFAFSQPSQTGSLVAAIASSRFAHGHVRGHSIRLSQSLHTVSPPSRVAPHASAFSQPSAFAFAVSHTAAFPQSSISGSLTACGCLWQLLPFPSLLARGRHLPAFDSSVFSHGPLCQHSPSCFAHTATFGNIHCRSLFTHGLVAVFASSRSSYR